MARESRDPVLAVAIDFAQAREYFQDPSLSFPSGRVVTATASAPLNRNAPKQEMGEPFLLVLLLVLGVLVVIMHVVHR